MTIILAASATEAHAALAHANGAPTETIIVIRVANDTPAPIQEPLFSDRKNTWRTGLFDDDDFVTWEDAEWR